MNQPTDQPPRQSHTELSTAGASPEKPLLMVDIDGVISLWGFPVQARPEGAFHSIDGIVHFLSADAGKHLLALSLSFELVWASGWEEKANEHLPHLLGLPLLPFLSFERSPGKANAHWKLAAIEAHAGSRPLAWIDDAFNEECHRWSAARAAPTLLICTEPAHGLTSAQAQQLTAWAEKLVVG